MYQSFFLSCHYLFKSAWMEKEIVMYNNYKCKRFFFKEDHWEEKISWELKQEKNIKND